jgi:hypothetical protein
MKEERDRPPLGLFTAAKPSRSAGAYCQPLGLLLKPPAPPVVYDCSVSVDHRHGRWTVFAETRGFVRGPANPAARDLTGRSAGRRYDRAATVNPRNDAAIHLYSR